MPHEAPLISAKDLLAERYPEIYFTLFFSQKEPYQHVKEETPAELERFAKKIPPGGIDLLYVFGLGLGRIYPVLRAWLDQDPTAQAVILEDDITAIASWFCQGNPLEILQDEQIHLRYVVAASAWRQMQLSCARDFPYRCIEVIASPKYAKTRSQFFTRLKLQLLRKTGMAYTYFSETLYAHLINRNLLLNAPYLAGAFDTSRLAGQFTQVPAIICGAGPSLSTVARGLSELEDRAMILAGGSAITSLGNIGVIPHLALAIDPNKEEYERFKTSIVQEVPLLYGHRLRHDVFSTFNGPLGYMRSHTGGGGETWLENELQIAGEGIGPELGPEAMSITALTFALAVKMGCNPIIFAGVDLAYVDHKRYASGVMRDSSVEPSKLAQEKEHLERLIKRKNGQDRWVWTLIRWVMEAEALGRYAKKLVSIDIYNASDRGLPIPGVPFLSMEKWVQNYCSRPMDLRGRIHAHAEASRFAVMPTCIQELLQPLIASLENLLRLKKEAEEEITRLEQQPHAPLDSGKMCAIDFQCEEEIVFSLFFDSVGVAFDQMMRRQYGLLYTKDAKDYRLRHLRHLRAKWDHIENATTHYLTLLQK